MHSIAFVASELARNSSGSLRRLESQGIAWWRAINGLSQALLHILVLQTEKTGFLSQEYCRQSFSSPSSLVPFHQMQLTLALLCTAALIISVSGQASPIENKRQSPAQAFIDAAQRIAGDGTSKVLKDAAQYLNPHIASEKGRGVAPGSNLATSSFASSNGGWTVTTSDGMVSDAQSSAGSITTKYAQGGKTLYFTSPSSWPTDLAAAYNGKLNFMSNPSE